MIIVRLRRYADNDLQAVRVLMKQINCGTLFRSGREKTIPKGVLEAVLLLPEKLFYNTRGNPGLPEKQAGGTEGQGAFHQRLSGV